MRLTSLRTLRPASQPNLLLVEVSTDEGLVGLGETFFSAPAVESVIHEVIAVALLGCDPLGTDLTDLYAALPGRSCTGVETRARSAIDIALWDLRSKAADLPLSKFLSADAASEIPTYNTCAGPAYVQVSDEVNPRNWNVGTSDASQYEDLDAFLHRADELAMSLLAEGITGMKIWPLDELAERMNGTWANRRALDGAIEPLRKIRSSVGDRIDIMVELHGLWSVPGACAVAAALEEFDVRWIEDPVPVHDMGALAKLRSKTKIPIAAGETLASPAVFRDMIERAAVDIVITDIAWNGGITPAIEIGRAAAAAGLEFALHDCTGPVVLAASTHVALSLPNVPVQESVRAFYNTWYHDLVQAVPVIERGCIRPPEGPGHGIELLPDLATRHGVATRVSDAP